MYEVLESIPGISKKCYYIILKYIASVYEDVCITKCTESCGIMGEQGDRERENNRDVI
jgi:hypothetical protein